MFPETMDRTEELVTHLYRLVHVARSVSMKRAITAIDAKPHLNFWRLILGNQMDIAVIEWCKVFGSDGEATHWKKVVPQSEHDTFRAGMLASVGGTAEAWREYWDEMRAYRDKLAAHHDMEVKAKAKAKIDTYPVLDFALRSSCFYYKYLIKELKLLGVEQYPSDLEEYSSKFEVQAKEIATKAMSATSDIQERAL